MIRSLILVVLTSWTGFAFAAADVGGCRMTFQVRIQSTFFWQQGYGSGMLTCSDATGETPYQRAVSIEISGYGFGYGLFNYSGVSGQIGWLDPAQIEGVYYVADANVAFGKGFGLSLDFYNQTNGLSFGGKLKAGDGMGVALNGSTWTIRFTPDPGATNRLLE